MERIAEVWNQCVARNTHHGVAQRKLANAPINDAGAGWIPGSRRRDNPQLP
ncbi:MULTISPECIES: hypothetical protein [Acidovorax]|uniref:Uncharacterized protein n=1 Tax=Acidovorax facilis TaxID=12917 RepID=A0ABV8DEC7_9BURK|nr:MULTISPECIES: hypothetical protein [Acidovorax]MBO1007158.1 hypothetical protein [Acidovorax sp. SD340]MCO4245061.1 hypothetical protein [Acidovorax facilis]